MVWLGELEAGRGVMVDGRQAGLDWTGLDWIGAGQRR